MIRSDKNKLLTVRTENFYRTFFTNFFLDESLSFGLYRMFSTAL